MVENISIIHLVELIMKRFNLENTQGHIQTVRVALNGHQYTIPVLLIFQCKLFISTRAWSSYSVVSFIEFS